MRAYVIVRSRPGCNSARRPRIPLSNSALLVLTRSSLNGRARSRRPIEIPARPKARRTVTCIPGGEFNAALISDASGGHFGRRAGRGGRRRRRRAAQAAGAEDGHRQGAGHQRLPSGLRAAQPGHQRRLVLVRRPAGHLPRRQVQADLRRLDRPDRQHPGRLLRPHHPPAHHRRPRAQFPGGRPQQPGPHDAARRAPDRLLVRPRRQPDVLPPGRPARGRLLVGADPHDRHQFGRRDGVHLPESGAIA
jgi:hypothetical protein